MKVQELLEELNIESHELEEVLSMMLGHERENIDFDEAGNSRSMVDTFINRLDVRVLLVWDRNGEPKEHLHPDLLKYVFVKRNHDQFAIATCDHQKSPYSIHSKPISFSVLKPMLTKFANDENIRMEIGFQIESKKRKFNHLSVEEQNKALELENEMGLEDLSGGYDHYGFDHHKIDDFYKTEKCGLIFSDPKTEDEHHNKEPVAIFLKNGHKMKVVLSTGIENVGRYDVEDLIQDLLNQGFDSVHFAEIWE